MNLDKDILKTYLSWPKTRKWATNYILYKFKLYLIAINMQLNPLKYCIHFTLYFFKIMLNMYYINASILIDICFPVCSQCVN